MKKIAVIILMFIFYYNGVNAQVQFEHDYDVPGGQFTIVNLEQDGQKYCTYEFSDEYKDLWLLLYNLDHSKFLELNFDLSSYLFDYDSWTGNVFYITENIFDDDIDIEVLVELDIVKGTENFHYLVVFNEDGTVMFEQANAYVLWSEIYGDMPKGIFITPNGPKMILDVFDGERWVYRVYKLGGSVTSSNNKITYLEPLVQSYPNPATDYVQFDLGENKYISQINFYDLNGKLIKVKSLNKKLRKFTVDIPDLAVGTYNYQILSHKQAIKGGKFIKEK